jgi:hypothetical protein
MPYYTLNTKMLVSGGIVTFWKLSLVYPEIQVPYFPGMHAPDGITYGVYART